MQVLNVHNYWAWFTKKNLERLSADFSLIFTFVAIFATCRVKEVVGGTGEHNSNTGKGHLMRESCEKKCEVVISPSRSPIGFSVVIDALDSEAIRKHDKTRECYTGFFCCGYKVTFINVNKPFEQCVCSNFEGTLQGGEDQRGSWKSVRWLRDGDYEMMIRNINRCFFELKPRPDACSGLQTTSL